MHVESEEEALLELESLDGGQGLRAGVEVGGYCGQGAPAEGRVCLEWGLSASEVVVIKCGLRKLDAEKKVYGKERTLNEDRKGDKMGKDQPSRC